ncbi:polymorphic toxin-type HINT domain-containing protein [Gimesia maris]|uniref:polymorphic toxin-type HINT domain-containing protein n=1 Tax=Gimesia maris TaxID=122 RepID=UPI003A9313E6
MHVTQHTHKNNDTSFTRKLLILSCFLFTSFCFWKVGTGLTGGTDTEILPSTQAAMSPSLSASRVVTTPIQEMRPGMRIVGRNPLRNQSEATIDPTPEGWRLVSVRMLKADGTYFEAELLRPLSWIYRHHAQPGEVIQLNMPEMYVVGAAEVLSVLDCPPIDSGDGPVVISTFKNVSHNVLNIYVEGETEPIGVTAGHPIWSEDRQAFVHTDQLQPGERLRSAVGKTVRITSIEIRAGPEPVYNLEIAGEHVYSVTGSGLLVHNSGPCDLVPRGYYDSGYIGIVNGSADEFSDTLRATFGTSDVLPSSRLVSQADTVGGVGLSTSTRTNPLKAGVNFEAEQLAELGLSKNNTVWRPTVEQTESVAFKVIVGDPKYTKGGLPKGTTLDATEAGLLEIKHGRSALGSTYQLRLQTFRSLTEGTPYTIRTTRPINPTFQNWLQRWGVIVEGIK